MINNSDNTWCVPKFWRWVEQKLKLSKGSAAFFLHRLFEVAKKTKTSLDICFVQHPGALSEVQKSSTHSYSSQWTVL